MCYTYDELSRLKRRVTKDKNGNVLSDESFDYDDAGNIISDSQYNSFVYDLNNRLTSYQGQNITYDADGNMTGSYLGGQAVSLAYDSANRLISAGGNTYTYNAQDVRVSSVCGEDTTVYTYNTNCRLSQLLQKKTNGLVTRYLYGSHGLILQENPDEEYMLYFFDYRGSTVKVTDDLCNIIDSFTYDSYGKVINRTGTSDIIFGYNGRDGVVTDENGLIYMRARYYSPELRRFVNADILHGNISDSTSLNRYAYVNGNPVSFVDPFGLSPDEDRGAIETEPIYKSVSVKKFIRGLAFIDDDRTGGKVISYQQYTVSVKLSYKISRIEDNKVFVEEISVFTKYDKGPIPFGISYPDIDIGTLTIGKKTYTMQKDKSDFIFDKNWEFDRKVLTINESFPLNTKASTEVYLMLDSAINPLRIVHLSADLNFE